MATTTGKVTATSRQGTGGSQTTTMTVKSDPDPPGTLVTFVCDADYFADAKDYLGKSVIVTHTANPLGGSDVVTGLKGTSP